MKCKQTFGYDHHFPEKKNKIKRRKNIVKPRTEDQIKNSNAALLKYLFSCGSLIS